MKAQIARIEFATDIASSNKYKLPDELEEEDQGLPEIIEVPAEDIKQLSLKELTNLSSWVHRSPVILKTGMMKHADIEHDDEDVKKKLMSDLLREDPYEKRLKPISQDRCICILTQGDGLPTCWIIRQHGDMQKRMHPYKPTLVESTCLSIRSLVWPGLVHMITPVFCS